MEERATPAGDRVRWALAAALAVAGVVALVAATQACDAEPANASNPCRSAGTGESAATVAGYALLVGAYLLALVRPPRRLGALLAAGGLVGCGLLAIEPVLSSDLVTNLLRGRLLADHGLNPYAVPPSALHDPLVARTEWAGDVQVHGPLVALLNAGWAVIGRAGDDVGLLAMRGGYLLAHLATGALLWRRRGAAPATLWTLNPLLLLESAGEGHNDAVMVGLAVAAVLAFDRGRAGGAAAGLVLGFASAMVKVATAPAGLLLGVVLLRRRRWAPLVGAAVACGVLYAVAYVTLLHAAPPVFFSEQTDRLSNSIWSGLDGLGVDGAAWSALRIAALGALVWLTVEAARRTRDNRDAARWAAVLALALIGFGLTGVRPWYTAWALGLACAGGAPRLARGCAVLAVVSFAWYFGMWAWLASWLALGAALLVVRLRAAARPDVALGGTG